MMPIRKHRAYKPLSLSTLAADTSILSDTLFSFLSLADHHRLGVTSSDILNASGLLLPSAPLVKRLRPWQKLVCLPNKMKIRNLRRLLSYARLRRLRFSNQLGNPGLKLLLHQPLQHLELDRCITITDTGMAHLQRLPLRRLIIKSCNRFTDKGVAYLSELPLQRLDLIDCGLITDAGFVHLGKCPLRRLDLSGCFRITGAGVIHLNQYTLQHLNLSCCYEITDAGLANLGRFNLQSLNLELCYKITDTLFGTFACLTLRSRVFFCPTLPSTLGVSSVKSNKISVKQKTGVCCCYFVYCVNHSVL